MKVLDKIALVLFSNIIVILSIIICLLIFGWLDITLVHNVVVNTLSDEISSKVVLGLCVIFILLGVKAIFFDSYSKSEMKNKDGILLENEDGKLLITKDTIENLVNGVVQGYDTAQNIVSKVMLDKENNVRVYITLYVESNVIIKELSANIQTKVKETVKTATDLDVQSVNIRVKNIAPKKNAIES